MWTASSVPEFISEGCDVIMSERGDSMSRRRRLRMLMSVVGVLESLP